MGHHLNCCDWGRVCCCHILPLPQSRTWASGGGLQSLQVSYKILWQKEHTAQIVNLSSYVSSSLLPFNGVHKGFMLWQNPCIHCKSKSAVSKKCLYSFEWGLIYVYLEVAVDQVVGAIFLSKGMHGQMTYKKHFVTAQHFVLFLDKC